MEPNKKLDEQGLTNAQIMEMMQSIQNFVGRPTWGDVFSSPTPFHKRKAEEIYNRIQKEIKKEAINIRRCKPNYTEEQVQESAARIAKFNLKSYLERNVWTK